MKIKHLNSTEFDMAMSALIKALTTRRPTEKDEHIELAIRLLKPKDAPMPEVEKIGSGS